MHDFIVMTHHIYYNIHVERRTKSWECIIRDAKNDEQLIIDYLKYLMKKYELYSKKYFFHREIERLWWRTVTYRNQLQ